MKAVMWCLRQVLERVSMMLATPAILKLLSQSKRFFFIQGIISLNWSRGSIFLEPSLSSRQQGTLVCYSYFDKKLYLYPTPDAVYQVQLFLSPMRLEELESASQEHPWFVYGFDLIKACAKYELYKNILKDPVCAAAAYNDFNEHL
ncbi:hypothetical protein [Bartonella henselae]|uniref:hypothetical protein n=2 Tax=Bartonella henselae TaxID=38323 RepID=UPI001FEF1163|nr:hypothetical protein [Bartonella henselae]